MEPSPYSPGRRTLLRVLAGRDRLLHRLTVGLHDVATTGRTRTQDMILVGPRGVGKTVAVSVYVEQARAGCEVVNLQAVSGRTGLVPSLLERAASGIARQRSPWTGAKHAFDRRWVAMVVTSSSDRHDLDEIFDTDQIASIAGVKASGMSVSRRCDEQVHHSRSRLPPGRDNRGGETAVTDSHGIVDGQCRESPLKL